MKKWIVVVVVAALIGAVWYYVRTYVRYTPVWFQPKFGTVTKGDIRVPISAAGLIEPNQRIEVKSKASGEVIARPVDEGTFVRKGDILLKLKEDDERRRRDSAQAELRRAKALWEQAKVSKHRADANILAAEAEVERLAAECDSSAFELKKTQDKPGAYSPQERLNIDVQHRINLAAKKTVEARLASSRAALQEAEKNIELQDAAMTVAQRNLEDAEERLRETTVKSQYDAVVTDVRVRMSEMIQSGTASLTGGTVVMYLADVSKKKVVARVDESDYGRVLRISPKDALPEMPGLRESVDESADEMRRRTGQVRLTVDAFPEETFKGVIERVEPQGRLNQGSAIIQYDVHVEITDEKAAMLPLGAQAQVEFTVESAVNTLRVPGDAVKSYQGDRGVWMQVDPEPGSNEKWGKKFIPCRFGITDGEYTQVIEVRGEAELSEGVKVYTKLPVDREELEG